MRVEDHLGLAEAAQLGEVVPVLVLDPARSARVCAPRPPGGVLLRAVAALDAAIRRPRRPADRAPRRDRGHAAFARARVGAETVAWTRPLRRQEIRADRDVQAALEESGIRASWPCTMRRSCRPKTCARAIAAATAGARSSPYFERWRTLIPTGRGARRALRACRDRERSAAGAGRVRRPSNAMWRCPRRRPRRRSWPPFSTARSSVRRRAQRARRRRDLGTLGRVFRSASCRRAARCAARVRARGDPFLLWRGTTARALWLRALAQRDFFLQLGWYNDALDEAPLQEKMRRFAFARTHPQLDAWRSGTTGFPLVDAGIRELRATGRMHPRVRAIAASFLCFDLGVDWRVGRDEWDRFLIEDDPALATGNWQWVAGVGADLAAYPRIYNPVKQAHRFDPAAGYVRRWIPDSPGGPTYAIFDPGAASRTTQLACRSSERARIPRRSSTTKERRAHSSRATRVSFPGGRKRPRDDSKRGAAASSRGGTAVLSRPLVGIGLGAIAGLGPLAYAPAFRLLQNDVFNNARHDFRELWLIVLGMFAVTVISNVAGYGQSYLTRWSGQRMIATLRARMFDHVNRMSLADFDRWRPGEFMSRFSNDLGLMTDAVSISLPQMVQVDGHVRRRADLDGRRSTGCWRSCCWPARRSCRS